MFHTGKFRPASNKTNINVDNSNKMSKVFLLRMWSVYLWNKVKKTKSLKSKVYLHSSSHCGQPNHTCCSRAHSICVLWHCNTANSVHPNMYSTWAFHLSKLPCSIHHCNIVGIKSMHGGSQWLHYKTKIDCKTPFFLLRMSVNTSEQKTKSEFYLHSQSHS